MLLDVNKHFVELFGLPRESLVGQPGSTTRNLWYDQAARVAAFAAFERDGRLSNWEVLVRGSDGLPRHMLLSVQPIPSMETARILICMSGYTSLADTPNAINIEGLPLLQKPFSPASLLKYVRAELDRQV